MIRDCLQNLALLALVAALLAAIVSVYRMREAETPLNLKGHVIIDGSMTANPPAPPSMQ